MEKLHEEIHRQFAYRLRCNLNRKGMKDERPVFGVAGDGGRRRCPYNAARCPGRTGKAWGDVANGDVADSGVGVLALWLADEVAARAGRDTGLTLPG